MKSDFAENSLTSKKQISDEKRAYEFIKNSEFLKAENIYRDMVSSKSTNYIIYSNFAALLQRRGVDTDVENLLKKAIELKSDYSEAHSNLGAFYLKKKHFDRAIQSCLRAIEIKPAYPDAIYNLANAYVGKRNYELAIINLKQVIIYNNKYIDAYLKLGELLDNKGEDQESIKYLIKVNELDTINIDIYLSAGKILNKLNQFKAATKSFENVINIDPSNNVALVELIKIRKKICDWKNYVIDLNTIRNFANMKLAEATNIYMYMEDDPKIQLNLSNSFFQKNYSLRDNLIRDLEIKPKVRIGYFSADFRDHPVTNLLIRIFELHDKSKFELYAYDLGANIEDQNTKRIISSFKFYRNIMEETDDNATSIIRGDNLDIAVDLMGYSRGCRPLLFANRLAPIQINYMGYPGTMGTKCMDFIVADKYLIPDQEKKYYSEEPLYLEKSPLCCDDRLINMKKIGERREYGLPDKGFIFTCFNNNLKICPTVFQIWMNLLHRVEDSCLWLYAANDLSRMNLLNQAEELGISQCRIKFISFLPLKNHLLRHTQADLFLDTFNFSAGATAIFSLISGTPLITYYGRSYCSRMSSSLLQNAGLSELIVYSKEDYEEKAFELATNQDKYNKIKLKLKTAFENENFLNSEFFTRELESKYMKILSMHQD